jgi:hypothetical protein
MLTVLWGVTQCIFVEKYQYLEETFCLYHQKS